MARRFPRQGNEWWPLPPDYPELTARGQRLARLNVVKCRDTPSDDVVSDQFFNEYYLNTPEAMWFDNYVEPAPGHAEWTRACAQFTRVVIAGARGMAKSTKFRGYVLRDAVSLAGSKTLTLKSTQGAVEDDFSLYMRQLEMNPRIIEDFGELRAPYGKWNHSTLDLIHGGFIKGGSTGMKSLRGRRPTRILGDDLEVDPKSGTATDQLIADMEQLLFRVLLPMLRRGSVFNLIGNVINRRMWMWRLCKEDDVDPRIDTRTWFRKFYPGSSRDHTDVFWPAECPPEEVARRLKELGTGAGAEWFLQPTSGEESPFKLNDLVLYECDQDIRRCEDPLNTPVPCRYLECGHDKTGRTKPVPVERPFGDLVQGMTRFITVDPCRSPSLRNDWAVIHVMGVDKLNQLWSLDMWNGKVRYPQLIRRMWSYVSKWKVRLVGVEAILAEEECYQQAVDQGTVFADCEGWVPSIAPITYPGGVQKGDRINALENRFIRGLVKLPKHLRYDRSEKYPPYVALFDQVEGFTPDLTNLEHDDHIDTLSMGQWLLRRRKILAAPPSDAKTTPLDWLKAGDTRIGREFPVSLGLDLQAVNVMDVLDALEDKRIRDRGETPRKLPGRFSATL